MAADQVILHIPDDSSVSGKYAGDWKCAIDRRWGNTWYFEENRWKFKVGKMKWNYSVCFWLL